MSWASSAFGFIAKLIGPSTAPATLAPPSLSSVELIKGLESLAGAAWADGLTAAKAKFVNPGDDIVLLEDIALIAESLNVPDAGLAVEGLDLLDILVTDLPALKLSSTAGYVSPSAGHSR